MGSWGDRSFRSEFRLFSFIQSDRRCLPWGIMTQRKTKKLKLAGISLKQSQTVGNKSTTTQNSQSKLFLFDFFSTFRSFNSHTKSHIYAEWFIIMFTASKELGIPVNEMQISSPVICNLHWGWQASKWVLCFIPSDYYLNNGTSTWQAPHCRD